MNGYIKNRGGNTYQLTVTLGSDYRGKRKRFYKTITAKNEEEAKMALAVFYNDCAHDRVAQATSMTLRDFIEIWDKEYAKPQLKKSTYTTHKRNIEYNFGMLVDKKLNQIKPKLVRQWISYLYNDRQLSAKTVKNNYSLLKSILHRAVLWEYIDKNPADNVELPKIKPHEVDYYSEDELKKLLEVLETVPRSYCNYKVAILLGLFAGLRKGEIAGLDVSDVDFENRTITVRKTRMVYGAGGLYQDTPKTLKSARTIAIPQKVLDEISDLLKYHKEQAYLLGESWIDSPALIKNETGGPIYPQSLYRWLIRLEKKNRLPHLSLHGCRHTHTSMLRGCDVRIEEVSKRLGHSQKSTTLNIYSHLFTDRDTALADTLDEKFLK